MLMRLLPLLAVLICTARAADTPPPDFSNGLEKLAALGLPDMRDAVWEKAPDHVGDSSYLNDYSFRELKTRLKGSGWKLKDRDGAYLAFADSTVVETESKEGDEEAEPSETRGLLARMTENFQKQNPDEEPTKPKKARTPFIETDAESIITALGKDEVREEILSNMSYRGAGLAGRCLLFAAQIHASGNTELANRLAAAVFQTVPDRAAVVDAAVSVLGDAEYEVISNTFFREHDWKAYHESLGNLMEKYPRGWEKRLAVALLMPALESRSSGSLPPAPSLPDIELSDEALEILAELIEKPSGASKIDPSEQTINGVNLADLPAEYRQHFLAQLSGTTLNLNDRSLWLFPTPEDPEEDDVKIPKGPIDRLKALGMDGLIALAAVAEDDTLTHFPSLSRGSSYYSSSDSAVEKATRDYRNMSRPLTRGEIAVQLLAAVLPSDDTDDYDERDPASIRDEAIEFWKQNRDKNLIELAERFLTEGSSMQLHYAAMFLVNSPDQVAHQAFENAVLDGDEVLKFTSVVEHYIKKQKIAAQPFFERYSKLLTAVAADLDDDQLRSSSGGYALREAGGVEPFLKRLGVNVGTGSVTEFIADLIAEAMKSKPEDNYYRALYNGIGSVAVADLLPEFGTALATAKPDTRAPLLQTLLYRAGRRNDADKNNPPPQGTFPPELAALWKPLIEDEAPLGEKESDSGWFAFYDCHTLGKAAALTLEMALQENANDHIQTYVAVHPGDNSFPDFITRRTLARIEGQALEDYPSAEKVSAARQKEIAALAATNDASALQEKVLALNFDERAAWLAWWGEQLDEAEKSPKSLNDLLTLVTGFAKPSPQRHPNPDPELLQQLGLKAGYQITESSIPSLAAELLKLAEKKSGTRVDVSVAPLWLGLEAIAFRPDPELTTGAIRIINEVTEKSGNLESFDALALVSLTGGDRQYGIWGSTKGEIKLIGPSDESSFADHFKMFREGNPKAFATFSLIVFTREDIIKKQEQE